MIIIKNTFIHCESVDASLQSFYKPPLCKDDWDVTYNANFCLKKTKNKRKKVNKPCKLEKERSFILRSFMLYLSISIIQCDRVVDRLMLAGCKHSLRLIVDRLFMHIDSKDRDLLTENLWVTIVPIRIDYKFKSRSHNFRFELYVNSVINKFDEHMKRLK